MIYAVQPFTETIVYTQGDVAPLCLGVYCNAVAYSMTGTIIVLQVRDKYGTLIQEMSTTNGKIVINNSELTITPTAFANNGNYRYDMEQIVGSYVYTIGKGPWVVQKQITS